MKNNEKGIVLGFAIIGLLVLLLLASFIYGTDKSSELIFTGVYIQCWGILFLLSYFFSNKTFFFRGLIWLCENFSHPKGRKMAFFYFALAFGLGTMVILQGISEAKQKLPTEFIDQNAELNCKPRPPILNNFSSHDSKNVITNMLLSTSFETTTATSAGNIVPFLLNPKAPLSITSSCSNSGEYSLDVIPRKKGFLQNLLPFQQDRIKICSQLSSSFNSNTPFDVEGLKSVKLSFMRYSTSNPDKREDFNCGTSLNVYYRLDGKEWKHKMAYCGQHITETTGWNSSELLFDTQQATTIDFLFSYQSSSITNNPGFYLIDDLKVVGQK